MIPEIEITALNTAGLALFLGILHSMGVKSVGKIIELVVKECCQVDSRDG